MKVGVPKETFPGERRVALVPANAPQLAKVGCQMLVESGAGVAAGFSDADYLAKGAEVIAQRDELFREADIITQVRAFSANNQQGESDLALLRPGQLVIGLSDPLGAPSEIARFAQSGATLMALELVPRITRAQSMDVLSSQATIAGYRAVLLAAVELPKMFPLMMTAAGTLAAARVLVLGAGVAGLQAIATSRRLGGIVHGYDVRPTCREQVESLGAKFVELAIEVAEAEDRGGYAKAMGEAFNRRQQELLTPVIAASDVVITTAAIPGKTSPLLVTADAVRQMAAGSVIVDLAAERGGNCALSQPDQRVVEQGVVILGPTNLPSEVPRDASLMFGNNVTRFLLNMVRDKKIDVLCDDEIVRETTVTRDGEVVHPRVRELLGLPQLEASSVEKGA